MKPKTSSSSDADFVKENDETHMNLWLDTESQWDDRKAEFPKEMVGEDMVSDEHTDDISH